MGKWGIGTQVTAREGTILTDGDPNDPAVLTVEAGTLGIVIAQHGIARGFDGSFGATLTVRFPGGNIDCGSDELNRQGRGQGRRDGPGDVAGPRRAGPAQRGGHEPHRGRGLGRRHLLGANGGA